MSVGHSRVLIRAGMSASLLLHNVPRWGAFFGGLLLVPYVVPEVVRALSKIDRPDGSVARAKRVPLGPQTDA